MAYGATLCYWSDEAQLSDVDLEQPFEIAKLAYSVSKPRRKELGGSQNRNTRTAKRKSMGGKQYSVELLFKALADRTRLRIINLIGGDEICVCFLVEVLNINQPKISRHLAYLRRAKVVSARREGKWMHYRLVEPPDTHAASIFREVRTSLANDPEMQRDRSRLNQICCSPKLPVQLRRAPRPASLSV
jgi:ArsR family transcriptional regulator